MRKKGEEWGGTNDLLHQVQQSYMSEHKKVGQLDTKQQFLTSYIAICISEHSAYVYFIPTLYLILRLQIEAETL